MGRFHRHNDGTVHSHDHEHSHEHSHEHGHHHEHGHEPGQHTHDLQVQHEYLEAHEVDPELLGDHSSYETGRQRIAVLEDIYAENDRKAAANRAAFDAAHVTCVNLMSSPGAGKTALLEATLAALGQDVRIGIVEGDIETPLDAERLRPGAAQVSLLNTGHGFGGECHLDAPMVAHALEGLDLEGLDLVMIENVGNLVCPAEFEVGEHVKAMITSLTEGEDKPLKYPVMFRSVEVIVINKMDLAPYLDVDMALLRRNIAQVNPTAKVIELSARTGEGMDTWLEWLRERLAA